MGVLDGGSVVAISKSIFAKNQTAIRVETDSEAGACVDLHKVVFTKNGVKVDGPASAP